MITARRLKLLALFSLAPVLLALLFLLPYYYYYSNLIEKRLGGGAWNAPAQVYAAPHRLRVGQRVGRESLINVLRRAGYREDGTAAAGERRFRWVSSRQLEITDEGLGEGPRRARLELRGNTLVRILNGNAEQAMAYDLGPELISTLFDKSRTKRKYISYNELPRNLIEAVIAIEDKRFYRHSGIDLIRVLGALWANLRSDGPIQGGSTLTQQFVKNYFLTPERTLRRKLAEALMALILERKFSKEKILELYANSVYLGQRGSFGIIGFGEAAEAYFNKDVNDLTLSEAALLAGIISAPNRYSPYRYPERARQRRDLVLDLMEEAGFISHKEKIDGLRSPLGIKPLSVINYSDAPYFIDHVRDLLLQEFSEEDLLGRGYRVYTTINLELQRAAYEAVASGLAELDKIFAKRPGMARLQAVLVALDPQTGHILAMIGGRNYAESQFNRAVEARRQPGSVFKPFVYAAAINTAFEDAENAITVLTRVVDEPTIFPYEQGDYEPKNYKERYHGEVTLRQAITHSLNVATIKIAQLAGFDNVVGLARAAGFGPSVQPYPSMPIGAFEATPLEIARAYTVFAGNGMRTEPLAIVRIAGAEGTPIKTSRIERRPVVSPEVAYIITNLLQGVIAQGTGYGVRARGFTLPVAGKTGTSHDGWFAGYTPDLLCVVWVGFDDHRELGLSGAASALPIWTEFMKRAAKILPLSGADFIPPEGVSFVEIDPITGLIATPFCQMRRTEVFISGTEAVDLCYESFLDAPASALDPLRRQPSGADDEEDEKDKEEDEKKKGLLRKIFSIFR